MIESFDKDEFFLDKENKIEVAAEYDKYLRGEYTFEEMYNRVFPQLHGVSFWGTKEQWEFWFENFILEKE